MIMDQHVKIWLQIIFWLSFDQVQDVGGGTRPVDQKSAMSLSDANLMFEFLLSGLVIDEHNNILLLDEEMASMRKGREFLVQMNDGIPRSWNSMMLMADMLEARQKKPLTQVHFDNLVLSSVYSAQQASAQGSKEEREAWGEVLLRLANITVYELRGSFLLNYS